MKEASKDVDKLFILRCAKCTPTCSILVNEAKKAGVRYNVTILSIPYQLLYHD
jgi:hypothetical protein